MDSQESVILVNTAISTTNPVSGGYAIYTYVWDIREFLLA